MTAVSPFQRKASSKGGGNFSPPPDAGAHAAVLVAMIDLGLHENSFEGKATGMKRMCLLVWELPSEKIPGTTNSHVIGREYTVSDHEKAGIRKLAEAVRGAPYADGDDIDYTKLVGRSMLVTVQHKPGNGEKVYASVGSVTALPKAMPKPVPTYKPFVWFIGSDDPIPEQEWLPWSFGEKIADKIKRGMRAMKIEEEGEEEAAPDAGSNGTAEEDSEIPF